MVSFFFWSNKHHGFFVPNVEYLKDPEGLLTYLGLKVQIRQLSIVVKLWIFLTFISSYTMDYDSG